MIARILLLTIKIISILFKDKSKDRMIIGKKKPIITEHSFIHPKNYEIKNDGYKVTLKITKHTRRLRQQQFKKKSERKNEIEKYCEIFPTTGIIVDATSGNLTLH